MRVLDKPQEGASRSLPVLLRFLRSSPGRKVSSLAPPHRPPRSRNLLISAPAPSTIADSDITDMVAERNVTRVHVVAYPENGTSNHWVSFLDVGDSEFVIVNMTPGADGSTGCVMFNFRGPEEREQTVVDLVWDSIDKFTVGTILRLVKENRMDKYRFNSDSEGCSLWIHALITKLVGAGYLSAQAPGETWDAIRYLWHSGTEKVPRAVPRGTFY